MNNTQSTDFRDNPLLQDKDYRDFYNLLGGVAILVVGILIGAQLFSDDGGYGTNLYTELISVGATILILDRLAERREDRRREAELKARLIREAGSDVNSIAKQAVYELREHGWLTGESGLLKSEKFWNANLANTNLEAINLSKANFLGANLTNTNLSTANLSQTGLENVNLEEANLFNANLYRADLSGSNLTGSNLGFANLSKAVLWNINLANADLKYADLTNASLFIANLDSVNFTNSNLSKIICSQTIFTNTNLQNSNLTGAMLSNIKFDEKVILPDAKHAGEDAYGNPIYDKYWTPDTDMTRYTDPNHPHFWQPNWAKSQNEGE